MDKTLDQHIVEAANDVYAQSGGGLSECIYQAALAIALRQRGYGIETEVVVPGVSQISLYTVVINAHG